MVHHTGSHAGFNPLRGNALSPMVEWVQIVSELTGQKLMKPIQRHILFCDGSDCKKKGNKKAYKAMKKSLKDAKQPFARCSKTKCLGACKHAPVMVVYPDGIWYTGIKKDDVQRIVAKHIVDGNIEEDSVLHQMTVNA
jgi:(2Fe-2S) ferredoxin